MPGSSWNTIGLISPPSADRRQSPSRPPLADTTARVNNSQPIIIQPQAAPRTSSHIMPHHESLAPKSTFHTPRKPGSPNSVAQNKHISAIASQEAKDANRLSLISTTSTNADGKRKRKTHVGPWHLGKTLGKGATGRVRFARHKLTGQPAAIKIVSKKAALSMQSRSIMAMDAVLARTPGRADEQKTIPPGIEREMIILKLIEHPNIISLYDVWENRGEFYLVMEYVEGGELYGHIDKHRCLPEFEAVRIFRQIISALGYCHRLNIYHRDLKPENILLDANQNVKLVDFGMAALQPQGKWLKTSCGSPHYAAPEIAWGHKYQGAPVDVWSSGVVLYAMLIGRLPFGSGQEGEDPKEVLKDVVRGEVTIPEDVSEEAEDLILRMLQLNPEDRITIDQIWEHPLIRKYEPFTRHQKYASKWIGGPPPLLTEKDCGTQLRHRREIDPELLKNLCSLWQYPDEEILIAILLSDKACYEKVFYNKLLRYRDEQLENYQGHIMEFSTSDYHHITKPSMRRSSTRASMHARGHIRNKSVFSIKDEPNRRPSYASGRQPSEPETVQSYDPYRSSRTQIANTQADHARITVLRGQADFHKGSRSASGTPSFCAPSLGRVKSGAVYSISSSPPPLPANLNGRPLTLRREHLVRNYSRTSSVASSRLSYRNSASGRFKASTGYRRSVSFNHARRGSNGGLEPTPRVSKAPQSIPLREKYLSDEQSRANYNHLSPAEGPSPKSDLSPQVRSRKEKPTKSIAEDIMARKSKRASIYWKEEARKISSELENLCDEAFNPPFVPMEPSTSAAAAAGPNNVGQESLDVPVANEARFAPSTIVKPHRNIVPDRLRPLPKPPLKDHIDTKAQDELAKAKELLVKRAQDLSPGALDEVIAQIDRLMQQRNLGLSPQEYELRIVSAPITKSLDPRLLSPVKEVEEHRGRKVIDYQDYRAASLPTGTTQNDSARPLTRRGDEKKSTVRLVDHSPVPRPAPLVIRKRSADSNNKAYTNADDFRPVSYHQSGALEPIHNGEALISRSRLGNSKDRGSTGTALLDLSLNPIFEDENRENSDPVVSKRESGDSRKKGWFRKRWSDRSHESDGPPSPLPKDDVIPQLPFGRTAYGKENKSEKRASDVPSEESRHSEPSHEITGKGIFFKIFSKRDTKSSKRVSELALTGRDLDDVESEFDSTDPSKAWMSGALANESTISVNNSTTSKHAHFIDVPIRTVQPQARNWFARLLHIQPARRVMALQTSALRTRRDILVLFRNWKQHGMADIVVDKVVQRIWARVSEDNPLGVKPVSLACEIFPIFVRGRKANLCLVRFTQEKGAKSTFERVVNALEAVLRRRGAVVGDKKRAKEMKRCLQGR